MWGAAALVALRLGVGAHFYMEGADKVREGFSSEGFLSSAVGPLAPLFHAMAYDRDGLARLNYDETPDGAPRINLDKTLKPWAAYRDRVIAHYGFDDGQKKRAAAVFASYRGQLEWFFTTNQEDIEKYFRGLKRRDAAQRDRARRELASLAGQVKQWTSEMNAARRPWLETVEKLWAGYERDLNAIAAAEQRRGRAPRLGRPGGRLVDSRLMDRVVPWFDLAVGVLLLLGLFTRAASLAGGLFLASIVATQWPGTPGAQSTIYQIVEMLAMFTLAAVGAGRFAGLDYVVQAIWAWRRPLNKGAADESDA